MARDDYTKTYVIPDNFIEGGRVFNGMFRTRNFVEAIIISAVLFLFTRLLPLHTLSTKLTVSLTLILPFAALAIIGVDGDPLSVFILGFFHWRKQKKTGIMLYNVQTRLYESPLADMLMAGELPIEKISNIYSLWNAKRKNANIRRLRTSTFEFEEEDTSRLKTRAERTKISMERLVRENTSIMNTVPDIDVVADEDVLEVEPADGGEYLSVASDNEVDFTQEQLY